MKRIWHFLLGLLILITVGVLLLLQANVADLQPYQDDLMAYNWFEPALYITAAVLLLIGLIYLLSAFKRSYKSKQLLLSFSDGEIVINKKSIEKNVQHTVGKYSSVRQPSIDVNLYQKKQSSYVDVNVDAFIVQTDNVQTYLTQLKDDIRQSVEHFAELPVREVTINILDQKTLKKRVL